MSNRRSEHFSWIPEVQELIRKSMQRSTAAEVWELKDFITSDDLNDRVWKQPLSNGFFALDSIRSDIPFLRNTPETIILKEFIRVISILVWMEWPRSNWNGLDQLLQRSWLAHQPINGPQATFQLRDPNIPFSIQDLERAFPDAQQATRFMTIQFPFCPTLIVENEHLERPHAIRLPFITETDRNTDGAYGEVTKVTVGPGYFKETSGELRPASRDMARKRFTIRSNFSHELRNLKILQSNDLRHDRIMMSLGSVTVGEECNLLFNWAELDLEKFLRGKPLLPGLPTQGLFPHLLLAEVTGLAGALDFLHRSIWMEGTLQSFCHMDLKPNNILVMGNHTSPIGRWKITDFGISNLEASSNVASTRDLWMKTAQRTSNQSPSIRYPGPYQPPEAEPEVLRERVNQNVETPGYKSDVWSFGCVVLAVLVFSIGGPRYFRELENQLSQESLDCDGVDRAHRFYRNVDGKFQIHTFISSWLPLISGSDLSWVAKAWDYLARKVLRIDPINRVSALKMREELHSLTQQAPRVSNWNPASIIPIPPFPPEGQRRRSTRTRSELFRLAVTSAITSGPGLPQRPNHSTGTRDRHGDTVINRDSRLLVPAQNPSLVPHIQINEPSNASSPPTISTPVSTSQSQESSLTTWSTRGGASSNLAHDLYMQQNVKIASGGQRIVFWNDSRAKAYNRSTEPNSLFTTDMARTFPPNGSTTTVWDDVLIAGDFLALRKRPRQRSPGILDLHSLNLPPSSCQQEWTAIVDLKQLLGIDLAPDGALAFHFARGVKAFKADGTKILDYGRVEPDNVLAASFNCSGRTLVAVFWKEWKLWQLADDGLFHETASDTHNFAMGEFGEFKPQALPLAKGARFGLRDLEFPSIMAFAQKALPGNAVDFKLDVKGNVLAVTISTDDSRLVIVTRETTGLRKRSKYFLTCYELIESSVGIISRGNKTMDKLELTFTHERGLQVSLTAILAGEGLVALVAASTGMIESIALK